MKDPYGLYERLKSIYLRYYDSPFALRYESLMDERRASLETEGIAHREPYIELLPPYDSSDRTLEQACQELRLPLEMAYLTNATGLFPEELQLYEHQWQALRSSMQDRRHVVVTAGTGSGKTECFLLPILASLLQEARGYPDAEGAPQIEPWRRPSPRPDGWDWWRRPNFKGTPPCSRPQDENRQAAVRAMILYPMNALVEDQLMRLRKALDSDEARDWFRQNLSDNRFYFGRYIGRTPVSGPVYYRRSGQLRQNAVDELRRALDEFERTSDAVQEYCQNRLDNGELREEAFRARYFFPRVDGAEMLSRWDMQEAPPDILITNYSMLNVMLMRDLEEPIFEATSNWLRDERNVFTLVVDELHTYRGTPGTEVALLIRKLLFRLGLQDRPEQVRFIATSASLTDEEGQDASGSRYLSEFFGAPQERFAIIGGCWNACVDEWAKATDLGPRAQLFQTFSEQWRDAQNDQQEEARAALALASELGVEVDSGVSAGLILSQSLNRSGALRTLFDSCLAEENGRQNLRAQAFGELAYTLFGADNNATEALAGLLLAAASAESETGLRPLPVRVHYFFHDIPGVWACCEPECDAVDDRYRSAERPVGKLYFEPQIRCECGARVLELLYCQTCGEVYLGGYKAGYAEGQTNRWTLLPDQQDLEGVPDRTRMIKAHGNYAIYWPVPSGQFTPQDSPTGLSASSRNLGRTGQFRPAALECGAANVRLLGASPADAHAQTGYLYVAPKESHPARPGWCPRCGDYWSRYERTQRGGWRWNNSRDLSPIRWQGTGFERVNQVIADALMRELRELSESSRKLVLFSDSRQNAAKLSHGLEKSHYLDTLRQLWLSAHRNATVGLQAYIRRLNGEQLSDSERQAASLYQREFQDEALALAMEINGMADEEQLALALEAGNRIDAPTKIDNIRAKVELRLVELGINPAGPDIDYQKSEDDRQWSELYELDGEVRAKSLGRLTNEMRELRNEIRRILIIELGLIAFARMGRSLETLGLAYATVDPANDLSEYANRLATAPETFLSIVNGTVRILGEKRRFQNDAPDRQKQTQQSPPGDVRRYLIAVAQRNGWDEDLLISEVNLSLEQIQVAEGYLLNIPNLCLSDSQGYFWQCAQCNRIHLHESGRVCTDCQHQLDNPLPLSELSIPGEENYYVYLALPEGAGKPFRLHCEELTGQTNKTEALKRQRLFQDIAIRALGENPTMDSIDILSVTTTMEAGVDIGDLVAVMMANMPPQRFNYQQRVGRAGHRRGGLAGAITICGSRSHDNFYFQNPDRITGDPPPQPYLDLRRDDIIKRFLTAECLRQAFRSLGSLPDEDIGDLGANVHGQFGKVVDWEEHRDAIRDWLSGNRDEVSNVTEALLVEAPQEIIDRSDELIDWITNEENLLAEIDSAVQERGHAFDDLSELLANSGLLPMFGFPTKVRLLYHRRPRNSYPWPPDGVVDRELEIAISQFAPGSETVKDKAIHTAVGLIHYKPRPGRSPELVAPPYYDEREVGLCRACLALTVENLEEGVCPVCDRDDEFQLMRTIEPRGFRTDFSDGASYSGAFSYTPRATHPRMPSTPDYGGWTPVDRVEISSVHGATICSINDNNGELFDFLPARDRQGLIVPDAIPSGSSARAGRGEAQIFALASRKVTDVLLVRFTQEALPPGIQLTIRPSQDPVSRRAAWYSFGFLLRKAAALRLDIDPNEMDVGLRVVKGFTDTGATTQEGQLFISDSLDNGAGYANYFGTEERFRELLGVARYDFWSGQDNRISLRHGEIESAELCDSSCYDCLRDYDNQRFHSLLDWRLALDMVRLALGETVGLSDVYWNSLTDSLANSFCDDFHWAPTTFGGLPGARKDFDAGSVALIISHPLWAHSEDALPDELADAVAAARYEGGEALRIEIRDVFELSRRPALIDAGLQED